jgi:hypothetical protein
MKDKYGDNIEIQQEVSRNTLNTFDYGAVIDLHNSENSRKFSSHEIFGVQSLSSSFLARLNMGANIINNASNLFLFTQEEDDCIKKRRDILEKWQNLLLGEGYYHRVPLSEGTKQIMTQIAVKQNRVEWEKRQKVILDDPLTWQISAGDSNNASKIQKEWETLSCTSTWNNQQLRHIAFEVLPLMLSLQRQAIIEIKKKQRKIPQKIYASYYQHLMGMEEKLGDLKKQIANAMYFRLKHFDKQSKVPSTVNYFVKKLVRKGYKIKEDIPAKVLSAINADDPLTDKIFHDFHWYIEHYGQPYLVNNKLHTLQWFKENKVFPTVKLPTKQGVVLVPEGFRDIAPTTLWKPAWLFKGHNFRFNFFRKKLFFLATINKDLSHKIEINNADNSLKEMQLLNEKEAQILAEAEKMAPFNGLFNKIFRRKTSAFLQEWGRVLGKLHANIWEDKLNLVENLTDEISMKYQNQLDSFPWEKVRILQNNVDNLLIGIKKNSYISPALQERFDKLKNNAIQVLSANKSIGILHRCKNIQDMTDSELSYLLDYARSVNLDLTQDRSTSFLNLCQNEVHLAVINLKQMINGFIDSGKKIESSILNKKNFIKYYSIINHFGSSETKVFLDKIVLKIFVFFLQEIIRNKFDKKLIEEFEIFFQAVGQRVSANGVTIKDCIEELKESRIKYGYDNIYPIKCKTRIGQFANLLFKNRFEKEFNILERRVQSLLNEYDEGRVSTFLRIRQKLIDNKVATVEPIVNDLQPYEKSLIGIECEEYAPIRGILEISAKAHLVKNKLENNLLPYGEKIKHVNNLGMSLIRTFKNNPKVSEKNACILTNSGKRNLFSKQYISEEVFEENNDRIYQFKN